MKYENATADEVKKAQAPHNLFVSGLFLFDLMMTPAVLALKAGLVGLLVPLLCSLGLLAYIYLRSKKTTTWFVDVHWKLAVSRARLLLIGYALTAALIFIAWLISLASSDHNMRHIIWTALTRIALMPTLILVLATAVLEASAIPMVTKREVPDKLAASFPPPA
jgi:hypothetical protein